VRALRARLFPRARARAPPLSLTRAAGLAPLLRSELLKKEAEDKCRAWAEEAQAANAAVRAAAEREAAALRGERDAARAAASDARDAAAAADARAANAPSARVIAALEADASRGGAAAHTALEVLRRVGEGGHAGGGGGALGSVALYARVEVAESALELERAETAKLRAHIEHILGEIEARAPLLAQQRLDYERALSSHEELSKRLGAALREASDAAASAGAEAAAREAADAAAAAARATVRDLRTQLLAVLRNGAAARAIALGAPHGAQNLLGKDADGGAAFALSGFFGPDDSAAADAAVVADAAKADADGVADADAVVDEKLVTFGDIVELASKNAQLLRVVRSLTRALARAGSLDSLLGGGVGAARASPSGAHALSVSALAAGSSPPSGNAAAALRSLMAEIAELRSTRERQANMVRRARARARARPRAPPTLSNPPPPPRPRRRCPAL
jgi:nucleoprotein TPR